MTRSKLKHSKANRYVASATLLTVSGVIIAGFQNCSPVRFTQVSAVEASAMAGNPFDPNQKVGGVVNGDGYPSENLRVQTADLAAANFVKDCTATMPDGSSRYNYERNQALAAAANDPTHKLIPVEFAVSFGTTNDTIALWAHERAILSDVAGSNSNIPSGTTYIPVGSRNQSIYVDPNGAGHHAYYEADHTSALNDYRLGKNCFFDVVQVKGDIHFNDASWEKQSVTGEAVYPFISSKFPQSWGVSSIGGTDVMHAIHYMYYGWCDSGAGCNQATDETSAYGAGNYGADMYPNRLFGELPHNEIDQLNSKDLTTGITAVPQPQIVKLYVADLRNSQITNGGQLANQTIIPTTELHRGQELSEDLKTMMGVAALRTLWQNRNQAILNLSSNLSANDPDTKASLNFVGMTGMPQLFSNLTGDAIDGSVLAAQYTPIVLDLGDVGVMTSSVFGGTFFNMAAAHDPTDTTEESFNQPHATAWLGGKLVDAMAESSTSTGAIKNLLTTNSAKTTVIGSRAPSAVLRNEAPTALFSHDFQRVAQDGFLVMTDSDGKVRSSRNLFGNETIVNGKTYTNGFLALQALASKDCTSLDAKKKYLGPWDGDLYASKIQVWVDANRTGVVDDGELQSLATAGVLALNVCNVVNEEATDVFGNGTSLRSAFLKQGATENIVGNESEILSRIATGVTSTGSTAEFRLAIDLIFQVETGKNLFSSDNVIVPTTATTSVMPKKLTVNQ